MAAEIVRTVQETIDFIEGKYPLLHRREVVDLLNSLWDFLDIGPPKTPTSFPPFTLNGQGDVHIYPGGHEAGTENLCLHPDAPAPGLWYVPLDNQLVWVHLSATSIPRVRRPDRDILLALIGYARDMLTDQDRQGDL